MGSLYGTHEIVELKDEPGLNDKGKKANRYMEDDINKLFEGINIRHSFNGSSYSDETNGPGPTPRKNPSKKPMRMSLSSSSGIGYHEPVSLKQALRGLCISQASEMAAIKRLSMPYGNSPQSTQSTQSTPRFHLEKSTKSVGLLKEMLREPESDSPSSNEIVQEKKIISLDSVNSEVNSDVKSEVNPVNNREKGNVTPNKSIPRARFKGKSIRTSPRPVKTVIRTKTLVKKKSKQELTSVTTASNPSICQKCNCAIKETKTEPDIVKVNAKVNPLTNQGKPISVLHSKHSKNSKNGDKGEFTQSSNSSICEYSSSTSISEPDKVKVNAKVNPLTNQGKPISVSHSNNSKHSKNSKNGDKGEFTQSSNSSICEYSSSTSISEERNLSGCIIINRPHMSKDIRWQAINHTMKQNGFLGLRHFNLLKKLGCGDIGTVYLAELVGTNYPFAIKVMDNEFLERRQKMPRAHMEREILSVLDHPFLPTLYAHFVSENLSCLVMEYCPGGDLHVLRQKQPARFFHEQAARFYVAEVLLALEYLHMLGIVYRDLKPENILVREDGHIMVTDFDLSLRCPVNPILLHPSSRPIDPPRISGPCAGSSCIDPFCIKPTCHQVSCFKSRIRKPKPKPELSAISRFLPQLVAEPTEARSNSFVGTHEYLAPEIIKGEGHGSAVDWWTFGVFLYELLYGRTPFKGPGNDETLTNVILENLRFPETPLVSFHARDLIKSLLVKEPENRLGSQRGAAEIKQHPFFDGLNWALIRCASPPELPEPYDVAVSVSKAASLEKAKKYLDYNEGSEGHLEFELF